MLAKPAYSSRFFQHQPAGPQQPLTSRFANSGQPRQSLHSQQAVPAQPTVATTRPPLSSQRHIYVAA